MRLFFSPCGTSLLTNQVSPELHKLVFEHANAQARVSGGEGGQILSDHLKKRREHLFKLSLQDVAILSADINGLYRLYAGNFAEDTYVLPWARKVPSKCG